MKRIYLLSILVLYSLLLTKVSTETNEFQQEVIGKCLYYQTTLNPEPFINNKKNCTLLWEFFKKAFAFQGTCNVSQQGYTEFLEASKHHIPENKFIFWSHVYTTVMRYSNQGQNLFSIADTLYGFIGDSMKWCGNASDPDGVEQERQTCPGYSTTPDCPSSAEAAFWEIASSYYSKQARGQVNIMLNAEFPTPFVNNKSSYFATWELPNLHPPRVTKADILLVHSPAKVPRTSCTGDSIQLLQRVLSNQNVTSSCSINQRDIKFLLCSQNPNMKGCECFDEVSSCGKNLLNFAALTVAILVHLVQT